MDIPTLVDSAIAFYRSQRYKESTLGIYRCVWNRLIAYADCKNIDQYDIELGLRFAKDQYGLDLENLSLPHTHRANFVSRAIRCLSEIQLNGSFMRRTKLDDFVWPTEFEKLCIEYLRSYAERVKKSTFDKSEYIFRQFITFIYQRGIRDLDDITQTDIISYMGSLQRYSPSSIDYWLGRIRGFLRFARANGYCRRDLAVLVPKARYVPQNSIPTTFTNDEVDRLLSAVDRANAVGKRDYAMLLIAVRLGMRGGDICRLKFENLRWDTDEIQIVQQKTEHVLTLPLFGDVGASIIDYLRYGRPETDSEHVFVKHCAPFEGFASSAAMYQNLKKYLQLAQISPDAPKRAGLHALRHTLASALLEQGTPLPVISEVLGHLKTDTTKIYTGIDTANLKKCALEVPALLAEEAVNG